MADHEFVHGSMDINEQRNTFALFWTLTKWGSVLVVLLLILLVTTRTNAIDCKKSDLAAAHINACGKLPNAKPADAAAEPAAPAPAH